MPMQPVGLTLLRSMHDDVSLAPKQCGSLRWHCYGAFMCKLDIRVGIISMF